MLRAFMDHIQTIGNAKTTVLLCLGILWWGRRAVADILTMEFHTGTFYCHVFRCILTLALASPLNAAPRSGHTALEFAGAPGHSWRTGASVQAVQVF